MIFYWFSYICIKSGNILCVLGKNKGDCYYYYYKEIYYELVNGGSLGIVEDNLVVEYIYYDYY